MINVNKFENRIVKFKRISEGVETTKEAEIRRIDYDKTSAIPRSVTARFVEPLNAIMTLYYDNDTKTFRGPLGPDILESDFNINDFIKSSALGTVDTVIRSPKRNRPKL
tara:strand:- start:120 stop:446 length:327 start_codon:yes stop_codon:yes gene_type:complete